VQPADVRQRCLLGVAHVLQQCAGGGYRERQLIRAKALEIERAELIREQPRRAGQFEIPRWPGTQRRAIAPDVLFRHALGYQELRGLQALDLRGECAVAARFQHRETARGQIEPGQAETLAVTDGRRDQCLLALFQQGIVGHRARGDDAHDLPLHGSLGFRRIAHLLADGHALAFADESREVALHAVERHARHRDGLPGGLAASGQRDIEQRSGAASVVEEELVEVPHPVKEQRVRMPALDAQVLLHRWGVGGVLIVQCSIPRSAGVGGIMSLLAGAVVEELRLKTGPPL
jgi:hypothetical protein